MSRSRSAQCSGGRGCYVCGDAGESRRAWEDEVARVDDRALPYDLVEFAEDLEWADIDRDGGLWDGCSEYCCGGPFPDPYDVAELLDRYGWRPLRVNFLEVIRAA
jgi:hypothetical protein